MLKINNLNNKFSILFLNKFFFFKKAPRISNLFIYINNFKDNDIIFISSFIEDIICIKPLLKESGFIYDKLGNKIYSSYLELNISNKIIINNFIYYFYLLTRNLNIRRSFFLKLKDSKYIGIFSTFDIDFYLFRDIFSFVAFNFIFTISLKIENENKLNILIYFHFFKNAGFI